MGKIKISLNYTCPFIDDDCMHMDSLSMSKSVICNHCEVYIREKNVYKEINLSDSGIPKSLLTLCN